MTEVLIFVVVENCFSSSVLCSLGLFKYETEGQTIILNRKTQERYKTDSEIKILAKPESA